MSRSGCAARSKHKARCPPLLPFSRLLNQVPHPSPPLTQNVTAVAIMGKYHATAPHVKDNPHGAAPKSGTTSCASDTRPGKPRSRMSSLRLAVIRNPTRPGKQHGKNSSGVAGAFARRLPHIVEVEELPGVRLDEGLQGRHEFLKIGDISLVGTSQAGGDPDDPG